MANVADELVKELPPKYRLAGRAVVCAVSLTVMYFLFISIPISAANQKAEEAVTQNKELKNTLGLIQGDISLLRVQMERRDQKIDDMKEDISHINSKIDRLLMRTGNGRGG